MKNILLVASLMFVVSVKATIEYSSDQDSKPSTQEIQQSRSCFDEVAEQGCGDPGENPLRFRVCLKNIHPILSSDCQKMMTELYGVK